VRACAADGDQRAATAGTLIATARHMAAVLCLIFLPIMGAVLFMLGSMGGPMSLGTMLAGGTFLLLGAGIVVGTLTMSKGWESDD
jgi:hypothetical protein